MNKITNDNIIDFEKIKQKERNIIKKRKRCNFWKERGQNVSTLYMEEEMKNKQMKN